MIGIFKKLRFVGYVSLLILCFSLVSGLRFVQASAIEGLLTPDELKGVNRNDLNKALTGGVGSALDGLNTTAEVATIKTGNENVGVTAIIARVIKIVLGLVGVAFMILIISGGLMWMFAGGDEGKVKKARDIMLNATIGVTLVFLAYIFTSFILRSIIGIVNTAK